MSFLIKDEVTNTYLVQNYDTRDLSKPENWTKHKLCGHHFINFGDADLVKVVVEFLPAYQQLKVKILDSALDSG